MSAPFTERRYIAPLALVTSLFFLWAVGVNINDILIPHFKKAFGLTDFQSSLIQTAFFGGYFVAALPAGWVMRRLGYRRGILTGLVICAAGAALFIPASIAREYSFFLFALFVLACGQCFLEVGANPYVTTLGPSETASWRLNTAQAFNAVAASITPIVGAQFILSGIEHTPAELAAMSPADLDAYRAMEAGLVRGPYVVIVAVFLLVAFLFWRTRLPEVAESADTAVAPGSGKGILAHKNLVRGVVAQFFYVGAQVGVASFVIRFVQHTMPDTPERAAATFVAYHQLGFLGGRLLSAAALKFVRAPNLLALFAAGALVASALAVGTGGALAVWMVVLLGFFHSLMFPTIFALSIEGLGPHTKLGSSLLVMSIVGGAIIPAVMGRVSDATSIQTAFAVPLVCYVAVMYFAMRHRSPQPA